MVLKERTELAPEEVDAFLGRHETGVLTLARDDEPYAVPISYGYDGDRRRFYLRLVSTPESEKRRYLSSNPECRLVVYKRDGDVYHSVVATGSLEEVPAEELTVEHVEQYGDARRPLFEIWGESRADLNVQLYQLDPESVSGRRVVVDRDDDAN